MWELDAILVTHLNLVCGRQERTATVFCCYSIVVRLTVVSVAPAHQLRSTGDTVTVIEALCALT